jgi:Domain of unknown function DUF29
VAKVQRDQVLVRTSKDKLMSKYDDDFYAWTQEQAEYLRAGAWGAIDAMHVAEEIEDVGNEVRHAVESHLRNLLLHLLKWAYQPERRSGSWRSSIRNARIEIEKRLARNPSLVPGLQYSLASEYLHARELAADETDLPLERFPENCPWTSIHVRDKDFWPDVN